VWQSCCISDDHRLAMTMRLQQLTQCTWWWIWTASLMMLNTGCWQTHYTVTHWHTTTVLMAVLQGNLGWLVPLSFFVHLLRKRTSEKSLRVQLPMYADNVAMSTFAQCYCSNRLTSPACRVYSRKSAAAGLLLWAHAVTDRQTDRWTEVGLTDTILFHRPCSAYCARLCQ